MGSKIKQLQNELQHKIQTFDNQRGDPRDEYGEQQKQIKKLVQQFDPLNESVTFRSDANISDRHPSLYETIPSNCVNNVLRNIQTNYGTNTRVNLKPTNPIQKVDYSLSPSDFDPLVSSRNNLYSHPSLSETNESNLIDFN
jgi:copper chaperone CopZ